MSNEILFAFFLTLLAGLSTGVGSAIAFFAKKTNTRFLSVSLGFSAGVMIYVSFVEIFPKAEERLLAYFGDRGTIYTTLAFFGGIFLTALIDKFVPEFENPHEIHGVEDESDLSKKKDFNKLHKMGILTALAIAIHNFPEGIATFLAALKDPFLGVPITIAIAIHNIPEGISVSVPIFYATGDKKKAFILSFMSGLAEPLGALLAYFILMPYLNDGLFGVLFAAVGGIMVFISLDELLPSAEEYGEHHLTIYGLVSGMAVMATSLVLF